MEEQKTPMKSYVLPKSTVGSNFLCFPELSQQMIWVWCSRTELVLVWAVPLTNHSTWSPGMGVPIASTSRKSAVCSLHLSTKLHFVSPPYAEMHQMGSRLG